jgi:2-hydroxy-3-keto-5-methylthiopentenyl-1-phosphate phosphatase
MEIKKTGEMTFKGIYSSVYKTDAPIITDKMLDVIETFENDTIKMFLCIVKIHDLENGDIREYCYTKEEVLNYLKKIQDIPSIDVTYVDIETGKYKHSIRVDCNSIYIEYYIKPLLDAFVQEQREEQEKKRQK